MTDPSPRPELDPEGYLTEIHHWNEAICVWLADAEHIELTPAHWEVITTLRAFYAQTDVSPAMRPFVKLVREKLGEEKGQSIYLMRLFGGSPAKTAAKLAGLPRPTNCL